MPLCYLAAPHVAVLCVEWFVVAAQVEGVVGAPAPHLEHLTHDMFWVLGGAGEVLVLEHRQ